jgi:hypothetical protein
VTREKVKEMVRVLVRQHDPRYSSAEETAEAIMKIWDQGWTWEIPKRDLTDDAT